MRLIFMGTPDFAVAALQALYEAGHEIVGVYSQPPKPAGRGHRLQSSPVQLYAEAHHLPIFTPHSLRTMAAQAEFSALQADCAVVAAYGLILPAPILAMPRLGCINIHASLLPRWRGAAPIHRAILAGDSQTGITIMQMDAGLDTGAMLRWAAIPIANDITTPALHDELARLGASLIVTTITDLAAGNIDPVLQPHEGVTYAHKLQKSEAVIEWAQPAATLARQIRSLQPWPSCVFHYQQEAIKILAAKIVIVAHQQPAGTVLNQDCTIACGSNALQLLRVQRMGKAAMSGKDLLNGLRIATGTVVENG